MDIKKELVNSHTLLFLVSGSKYNNLIVNTIKKLSKKNLCYVTLNKTFDSLNEIIKKNKIDISNVVFIDAISKTIKKTPDNTKNCYFLSSPGALTDLSLVISKFLKYEFDYIVIDSVTNLLIYQKKNPVVKFVSNIVNKIEQSKTKGVFFSIDLEEYVDVNKEVSMFVDKVVKSKK